MVIGEIQFNPISKTVAHDCNYTNASTNNGHGARRCGISAVGNTGVGPSTVKNLRVTPILISLLPITKVMRSIK